MILEAFTLTLLHIVALLKDVYPQATFGRRAKLSQAAEDLPGTEEEPTTQLQRGLPCKSKTITKNE